MFQENLVENKHHKLARSLRSGPTDRDLKPNAATRDQLNVRLSHKFCVVICILLELHGYLMTVMCRRSCISFALVYFLSSVTTFRVMSYFHFLLDQIS